MTTGYDNNGGTAPRDPDEPDLEQVPPAPEPAGGEAAETEPWNPQEPGPDDEGGGDGGA